MAKTGHCSNSDPYEETGGREENEEDGDGENEEKQLAGGKSLGVKRRTPEDFSSCSNGKRATSSLCGFCHHEDHCLRRLRKEDAKQEMPGDNEEEEGMKEKARGGEMSTCNNTGHEGDKKAGAGVVVGTEGGGEKKIDRDEKDASDTDKGATGERIEREEDNKMMKEEGEEDEKENKKKRKRRVKFFRQRGHFDADAHDRGVCIPCAYYFTGEEGCLATSKNRGGICRYCHDGDHANPFSPAHPSKLLHFKGVCTPCTALQKGACRRTAETCIFCHHEDHLLSSSCSHSPSLTASSPKTIKKESLDCFSAQEEERSSKRVTMKRERAEEDENTTMVMMMKTEKREGEKMNDEREEGEEDDYMKVNKGRETGLGDSSHLRDDDEEEEEQEEGEVKEGFNNKETQGRKETSQNPDAGRGWITEGGKEEKATDASSNSREGEEDAHHQSSHEAPSPCLNKEVKEENEVHIGQDSGKDESLQGKEGVGRAEEEKKEESARDDNKGSERIDGIGQREEGDDDDDDVTTTSTSHEKIGTLQKKRGEAEEKGEMASLSEDDSNRVGRPRGGLEEEGPHEEGHEKESKK